MTAEQQDAIVEKRKRRRLERARQQGGYQTVALVSTGLMTAGVAAAIAYRYYREGSNGLTLAEQWLEMFGIFGLTCGAWVGMELWAQWAHKTLWHDNPDGWAYHESHHLPRTTMLEKNDVFALINAPIAFSMALYGFLNDGLFAGMMFGAGMGISLYGMSYMFVHDGIVHKRFPTGPLSENPYLKRVALAHKLHHSEKYDGVPWGLFFGPAELEAVGAKGDLDQMCMAADQGDIKTVDAICAKPAEDKTDSSK